VQGKPMVGVILAYFGALEDAEEAVRPMVEFGPPAMAMVQQMPYTALQMMLVDAFPKGMPGYFKAEMLDLTDDAIDTLVEMTPEPTTPLAQILVQPLGGAIADVAPEDSAFPARDAKWVYHALVIWTPDMAPNEVHIKWTKDLAGAMTKHARPGVYLNFVAAEEGADRVRSSYGPAYDRLVAVKDKYDPNNLFRLNLNIPPSAG
jgi:hypothetical protein